MAGLAAAGTEEGAFIYVSSASDMADALNKVAEQLGSGLAASLCLVRYVHESIQALGLSLTASKSMSGDLFLLQRCHGSC